MIARCSFFKDKVTILKAKRKLQGSNIFIGEDFCVRVRDIRRKLTPHLKAKRNEGCRVSMVFITYSLVERGSLWTIITILRRLNRDLAALAMECYLGIFMARLVHAMLWEHIVG